MIEQFLLAGFNQDQAPVVVPPDQWSFLQNVQNRLGYPGRVLGMDAVLSSASLLGPPIWLLNCTDGSTNYWIYADAQEVGVVDSGGSHSDLTDTVSMTSTASSPNAWTGGILNGRPFLNNGADPPKTWDYNTANDLTTLTGWPASTTCKAMRAFREFLFALNMTESGTALPDKLRWSASASAGALPTAWTAAATNDAGDATLSDTPGDIIDGLQLGQTFMVYKQGSAYRVQYVGGNFVFDLRLAFRTLGALTRNCIIELAGRHLVVTDGDVVLHDGVQAESICNQVVRRYLFNRISADNFQRVFAAYNKTENEVLVCYPSTDDKTYCDAALIWDVARGKWGHRELPGTDGIAYFAPGIVDATEALTWATTTDTWSSVTRTWAQRTFNPTLDGLLGAQPEATAAASKLLAYDVGEDLDGVAFDATYERLDLPVGDLAQVKTVRRIWPRVEGDTAGTVEVGARDAASDSVTWSAPVTFTPGTDRKVDLSATGRQLAIRFKNFERVAGFGLEYEPRGRF